MISIKGGKTTSSCNALSIIAWTIVASVWMYKSKYMIPETMGFNFKANRISCGHSRYIFKGSRVEQWLAASSESSECSGDSEKNDGIGDSFMESLRKRMEEVNDRATILPLVVMDSMLPRQVLQIRIENPVFMELIRTRLAQEEPVLGMVGMARLASGEYVHLKCGVEVHIGWSDDANASRETPSITSKSNAEVAGMNLKLKAGRRFQIVGNVESVPQGWTEARVQFLDFADEESNNFPPPTNQNNQNIQNNISDNAKNQSLNRAIAKAKQFTNPIKNSSLVKKPNIVLVDRWIQLAKINERQPGQIHRLVQDLGKIPPSEQPSNRAFWIGALINPIPAMGVALEIRPDLLTAETAEERVQIAFDGIIRSIQHMDGSKPMW